LGFTIAVAGKGGSGKTSIATLIIRYLIKHKFEPVLAVDADPNANLGESLGLEVKDTVGAMLDRFQKSKIDIPAGMTKEAYLEYQLNSLLSESHGLDLITMGRGEGQDCYCYPNLILRKFIDQLSSNYRFIVMDNEAGMEHLSRGTTRNINELLIVSNHSVKGIRAVARIKELVNELDLKVKNQRVIINMVPGAIDQVIAEEMRKLNLKVDMLVPEDEIVYSYDLKLKPLSELPDSSKAVKAIDRLMEIILNQ